VPLQIWADIDQIQSLIGPVGHAVKFREREYIRLMAMLYELTARNLYTYYKADIYAYVMVLQNINRESLSAAPQRRQSHCRAGRHAPAARSWPVTLLGSLTQRDRALKRYGPPGPIDLTPAHRKKHRVRQLNWPDLCKKRRFRYPSPKDR
jgi:hypothetical protein